MKRLNLKLVIILAVLAIVLSGSVFFLHRYQTSRNAGMFLDMAKEALEKKEFRLAAQNYQRYLHHQPESRDARAGLALALADHAELPTASRDDQIQAYNALNEALRRMPDLGEVRRRLAKYAVERMGQPDEAIKQYQELLKGNPEDAADLRVVLGKAFELTEDTDQAGQTYDELIEKHPHDVRGYVLKARMLRGKLSEPEQADQLVDQMVTANPELGDAYLERARYLTEINLRDAAAEDLKKALELSPEDRDTLVFAAEYTMASRDFATARGHLEKALVGTPDDAGLVRSLANLDWVEQKQAEAISRLKAFAEGHPNQFDVLLQLCSFQVDFNEIAGARETFTALQKVPNINNEFLEMPLARILISERKFDEAVQRLERARPTLGDRPYFGVQIDLMLATCYAELGQADKQLTCLERATQADPLNVQARRALAVLLMSIGREEDSLKEWKSLTGSLPEARAVVLKMEMDRRNKLPADKQDLGDIEKLLEEWKQGDQGGTVMVGLLEADFLASQGKFTEARAAAEKARDANPDKAQTWMFLVSLLLREKPTATAEALALIDQAEEKLPGVPELTLLRIDVLARQADDAAKAALAAIGAAADKLEGPAQEAIRQKLGGAYYRLGERDLAKQLWLQAVARSPKDAPMQMALFALAQEAGDEAGMQEAIDRLKENFGADSAEYDYARAARLASQIRLKTAPEGAMDEARGYLNAALQKRPRWASLHTLAGDVEALDGNVDAAIEQYQEASEQGDRSTGVARRLVQLLAGSGRWQEAQEQLAKLENPGPLPPELQKIKLVINQQLGQVNLEEAAQVLGGSQTPQDLIWLGQLYERQKKLPEAEEVLRRAVSLDESNPNGWIALVNFLVAAGKLEAAQQAIADAGGKVDPKLAAATIGRCYELLNDPARAAESYQQALAADPESLPLRRQLAEFCLRQGRTDEANKFLQEIIDRATTAPPKDAVHVVWARRQLARLLSMTGGYNQLIQGLELVQANAQDGQLALEDQMLKAAILSRAPDRKSREEALNIYQTAPSESLRPADRFQQAKLYEQLTQWERAREVMLQLMADQPDNSQFQSWFVQMLLKYDELNEALPRIDRMEQTSAQTLVTIELRVRALVQQNKLDEAFALLRRTVPNPLPPAQRNLLSAMGALLVELSARAPEAERPRMFQEAERYYRDFAAATPDQGWVLASYLGQHGDLTEALRLCQELLPSQPAAAVEVAMNALRTQRGVVQAQQFDQVLGWIEQLGDRVTPLRKLFLQADLADSRGEFDQAEALYRKILDQPGLSDAESITAMNNLSFLVAVRKEKGQEALELIQRAIDLAGPMSELLDTRAMAYLSVGESQKAIADLNEAIAVDPNGLKYFHLALAHQQANDTEAATKAFEESKRLGLKDQEISPIEQPSYRQLIEALN